MLAGGILSGGLGERGMSVLNLGRNTYFKEKRPFKLEANLLRLRRKRGGTIGIFKEDEKHEGELGESHKWPHPPTGPVAGV